MASQLDMAVKSAGWKTGLVAANSGEGFLLSSRQPPRNQSTLIPVGTYLAQIMASSSPASPDLSAIHDFCADVAIRAGRILSSHAWSRATLGDASLSASDQLGTQDKDSSVDIVTQVDVSVEKFVTDEIRKRYPDYRIIAEETYAAGGSQKFQLTDVSSGRRLANNLCIR